MANLIETTRYFFGDFSEGFSKESIANVVSEEYYKEVKKIHDIADEYLDDDGDLYENTMSELVQELNNKGYLILVGIGNVDFEIHTPTHFVRVLKEYGTKRVKTIGEDWSGESVDWKKVEVFLK